MFSIWIILLRPCRRISDEVPLVISFSFIFLQDVGLNASFIQFGLCITNFIFLLEFSIQERVKVVAIRETESFLGLCVN